MDFLGRERLNLCLIVLSFSIYYLYEGNLIDMLSWFVKKPHPYLSEDTCFVTKVDIKERVSQLVDVLLSTVIHVPNKTSLFK